MTKLYLFVLLITLGIFNVSAQEDIVTNVNRPSAILLDGDILYIAEWSGNKISKIDLSETNPTLETVIESVSKPAGLALAGNILYVSLQSGNKVVKYNLSDSSPTQEEVATGLVQPWGIALNGNDLYITEYEGDRVSKIDVTSGSTTVSPVIGGLNGPISFLLNGNDLYISEYLNDRVSRIDITSGTPTRETVAESIDKAWGMALFGDELFISSNNSTGKVVKADVSTPSTTTEDVVSANGPTDLTIYGNDLIIAEWSLTAKKISKFPISTLSTESNLFEEIRILPNPTLDYLKIFGLKEVQSYEVYNVMGKIVIQGDTQSSTDINVQSLSKGMYFLKLGGNKAFKFIKK